MIWIGRVRDMVVRKNKPFTIFYRIWYITLPFNDIYGKVKIDGNEVFRLQSNIWFFIGWVNVYYNHTTDKDIKLVLEAGYVK